MKKIFTLVLALMAMTFCAKAQTFLFESFENGELPTGWTAVDYDEDGFNWDAEMPFEGGFEAHTGVGSIISASYDNTEGVLYPDNWLITPAVELTTNAILSFWVVGQDPDWSEENFAVYVSTSGEVEDMILTNPVYEGTSTASWVKVQVDLSSYTGQTVYVAIRHYNSSDMYMLKLDDVEIFAQPTEATIEVEPQSIDFGTIAANTVAGATAAVTGYVLTAGITATATAPYEVSSNGTSFGATATLAQEGGTLYVRFAPTSAGNFASTITLSSTGATASIDVMGAAYTCDAISLPFTEDFSEVEVGSVPQCWTIVMADPASGNDPFVAEFQDMPGDQFFAFSSYAEASDYNEYFITPEINTTNAMTVTFDYKAYYDDETFRVGYSTSTDVTSFTWGETVTAFGGDDWAEYTTTIPAGAKYIAIHYTSEYLYYLFIDNINIVEGSTAVENIEVNNTRIYPNPANNVINVNANSNISSVEVYTIAGQKVANYTANGTQAAISVSNLSNGMYIMKINTENGVSTQKFNVAR